MLGGSIASLTVLGAPDLILLSLTELAAQTYRICRASKLPLLVDADHGYGNALNVQRTVEELETAGASALTIEDTLLPISFGEPEKVRLISKEEGIGKIRAARSSRQDPSLVIVARSSAINVTNLNDAVERFKAYESAGADAVFLPAVSTRDQIETISAAVKIPIMLGNLKPDLVSRDYLSAHGVRICLQGHQTIMAAIHSVHETLKALRHGTSPAEIANVASGALLKQVTHDSDYRRSISEFLNKTEQ